MSEINFDAMAVEDLQFFKDKYVNLFSRIKNKNGEHLRAAEREIPNPERIGNLDITLKGKLLFVAKKLFVNSLFSKITGVSPGYLDNDLDEIMTSSGRIRKYSRMDPGLLTLAVSKDLDTGLEKALEKLNTMDEKELIEVLKQLDSSHDRYLSLENFNHNLPSYEHIILNILHEYLHVLKRSSVDKSLALFRTGYNIDLPIDVYDEIDRIYKDYGQNRKVK